MFVPVIHFSFKRHKRDQHLHDSLLVSSPELLLLVQRRGDFELFAIAIDD
jgi:hypothetical protein